MRVLMPDLKIVIEIYRIVNRNKGEKKLQLCFHFELYKIVLTFPSITAKSLITMAAKAMGPSQLFQVIF